MDGGWSNTHRRFIRWRNKGIFNRFLMYSRMILSSSITSWHDDSVTKFINNMPAPKPIAVGANINNIAFSMLIYLIET